MPPNDQEPRYRLVDANGNVVGSLFLNGNGEVAIQDESGTETAFTANGISTPAVDTNSISTDALASNIQSPNDISGSRSFDTEFQNNTGHIILLQIVLKVGTSGDRFNVFLTSGSTGANTELIREQRDADSDFDNVTVTTLIPPGEFYNLAQGSGNDATIAQWHELEFA